MMNMYLQTVISKKKLLKKLVFCWHLGKVNDENPDPDPPQNVMDPQHCCPLSSVHMPMYNIGCYVVQVPEAVPAGVPRAGREEQLLRPTREDLCCSPHSLTEGKM